MRVKTSIRRVNWQMIAVLFAVFAAGYVRAQTNPESAANGTESVVTGSIRVNGQVQPYSFRRLPVSSFPQLPPNVSAVLIQRGCMIPQTWQAHRPENVIHGSFSRSGAVDWAVLCSINGETSLLVFFAQSQNPQQLAEWPEQSRLQRHDPSGVLGFNWGIDAATPEQFHDAFTAQDNPPPTPDHDAVADSVIDQKTIYHLYQQGKWKQYEADE